MIVKGVLASNAWKAVWKCVQKNKAVDVVFLSFCVVVKFAILYVCVSVFPLFKKKKKKRLTEDCAFVMRAERTWRVLIWSRRNHLKGTVHMNHNQIFLFSTPVVLFVLWDCSRVICFVFDWTSCISKIWQLAQKTMKMIKEYHRQKGKVCILLYKKGPFTRLALVGFWLLLSIHNT